MRGSWSPAAMRSAHLRRLRSLPGVTMVVGNSHKTQIAELFSTPYHGQIHVGDIFAAHEFLSAPVEDAERRPVPAESEDSGRLRKPMLVLHYSVCARKQPQRSACSR